MKVLVLGKATEQSESGEFGAPEDFAAMDQYASGVAFLPVLAPSVDPVWVYAGFAALAAVVLVATRGRLGLPAKPRPVLAGKEAAAAA